MRSRRSWLSLTVLAGRLARGEGQGRKPRRWPQEGAGRGRGWEAGIEQKVPRSGPPPHTFLDLGPLTSVYSQCPACLQRPVLGWGLPEIPSKKKEIKPALIKSHTGAGGLEGPCHLPEALIVHS